MLKKEYETERLVLQLSEPHLAQRVVAFYDRNEDFLRPVEPKREKNFYTQEFQRRALARDLRNARELSAVRLWLLPREQAADGEVIGVVGLGGITYGPLRSAFITYRLDKSHTGRGLMQEALKKLIEIAFEDLELHRLEANIMPGHASSLKLVERLGFEKEGLAQKYLRIDGVWEDHVRMVLLNEED